jgi:DUF4097 and DUF4098 domain-containing protein YvlB
MRLSKMTIGTAVLVLGGLLAMPAAAADRELSLSVPAGQALELVNLVGAAQLVSGEGDIVVRARVSADRAEHADAVRLVKTEGRDGVRVVVGYPDSVSRIHYDGAEFRRLDTRIDYQGRRMRVTSSGGDRIRVDLEIAVPPDAVLELRQGVGGIEAAGVNADLSLQSSYGQVQVADGAGRLTSSTNSGSTGITSFRGNVTANSGSGSITLENVLGDVHARAGSGGIGLRGVDGDMRVDTGSGGVRVDDVVGSLTARTGSGSVRVEGLTAGPALNISTGSGSVNAAGDLGAVTELTVRTGSGSVRIDSSAPLSLELHLSTGSGGFRVDVPSLSNVESGRRSFRATVGDGAGQARIATGSGSIRITAP